MVFEAGGGGRARTAALLVFVAAIAYFALFIVYGINVDDEGTLLAEFYRTFQGELPYRDFHMGYTPLGHYFNAMLFRFFGVSIVPLRWALATCHASVAVLLFAIARRIMPAAFALLPPVIYVAIMPFYPGEFASFNIPYPAWWGVLFGVASFWTVLRFLETRHLRWLAASGLLTGLAFAFKPNVGVFQLASGGLVLLLVLEPPAGGRTPLWQAAVWWALAAGVSAGLAIVFSSQASGRDVSIFLLPIVAVVLVLVVRRITGRSTDAPAHGLLASGIVYVAAMLVPVVPWAVTFLSILGWQRFTRQVLFIGAGFESHYYLPFHRAGVWDAGLLALLLAMAAVGILARARRLSAPFMLGSAFFGLLAAAAVLWRADMPEGLYAALVSRTEDLSFTAALIIHWAAFVAVLPLLWRRRRTPREFVEIAILVGAYAMYLQLYPRSDFMHVIAAVPLTLVLGAGLAARLAGWMDGAPPLGGVARTLLIGGTIAFAMFRVAPNVAAVTMWDGGPRWRPLVSLDLDHAPVQLELGRWRRLQMLYDVTTYVRANSAGGEPVFTFPAIELVAFLADRPQATRRGHFFPGWPGHDVEAEVVASLTAAPPRLAVVLHAHQLYFAAAPVYYYALRDFMQAHYRQVASFGDYAVLARRDVSEGELHMPESVHQRRAMVEGDAWPPSVAADLLEALYGAALRGSSAQRLAAASALTVERLDYPWRPVEELLDDPDPRIRTAAVRAFADASDPSVAVPLARALQQGRVPSPLRLGTLRRIWASGDQRVMRPLLEMLPSLNDQREYSLVLGTLESIGTKLAISDYWLGDVSRFDLDALRLPGHIAWRRRLANPEEDPWLRTFFAWVLPRLGDRRIIPALYQALGAGWPVLRSAATNGLVHLEVGDPGCDLFDRLVAIIGREPTFAPSIALAMYRRDPPGARRTLRAAIAGASSSDQAPLAWLMSATADPHFRGDFLRLLKSPDRELRLAALTGLARVGDRRTSRAVDAAAMDPDYEVREFAARAIDAMRKIPAERMQVTR